MKLTFWGAARQVTGSMFLLELEDDYRILIDCGLDMNRGQEEDILSERPDNFLFPFEPSMINLVLLTHAHIDHSGNIPNLYNEGFEGQILCTSATLALTQLLLEDAASLHHKKLKKIHSSRRSLGKKLRPLDTSGLYLERQVDEAIENFVTIPFNQKFRIKKGVDVTFIPTGHILGAANIVLEITENGEKKRVGFSGDIGRKNYPLLPDPQKFPEVDYLICESTYGNRQHIAEGKPEDILEEVIKKTCIDIPGRLIIPAFSVGRTQALLYTLNKLYTERGLPAIKVFADSPLALKSTKVYEKYTRLLNEEAQEFYEEKEELFDFSNLHYVENMKESRAISDYNQASIIISSSGMVSGGRVEQHIRNNIQNPYCTILMIGYAAEGTLGHRLISGEKTLRFNGKDLPVSARIERTDIFSGHGDLDDLIEFVEFQKPDKLKKLFLVHGDYESMVDFKTTLETRGFQQVELPKKGQSFEL
jgi:metallo-beta-lactamase family protein